MRCVNIDWLEVYCLESNDKFPCNADYFRRQGYFVREREYGTRQYKEMFTLEDSHGEPFLEVRRNPATNDARFSGFLPQSTHIRLVNRYCYFENPVGMLRDFLLKHDYIFKRIFRIDVAYDFEYFDSGDKPSRFAQRYVEKKYRKINQCHLAAFADDNWTDFNWQSLKWGNESSMVSTKLYDKSLELSRPKHDKPYIRESWFWSGLIDNPIEGTKKDKNGSVYKPDIWRIEFSMKSSADNWIVIDDTRGKRIKKHAVPHRLDMFDSREKLWQRFEELAYHYFRFKKFKKDVRKDRCEDKILFKFNTDREFYHLQQACSDRQPYTEEQRLKARLEHFREYHLDPDIRRACDILIECIKRTDGYRYTTHMTAIELQALQRAIHDRWNEGAQAILERKAELEKLLELELIF